MTTPMDQVLEAELLVIEPDGAPFPVALVAERIAATGFSFRDETELTRFVVSSDEPSRDRFLQRRREEPETGFPYTLMMDVTPERILVWPVAGFPPLRALSADFLSWLTATVPCQVADDDGAAFPQPLVDEAELPGE